MFKFEMFDTDAEFKPCLNYHNYDMFYTQHLFSCSCSCVCSNLHIICLK